MRGLICPFFARCAGAAGAAIGPIVALARGFPPLRYSAQTLFGFAALGALFAGTSS